MLFIMRCLRVRMICTIYFMPTNSFHTPVFKTPLVIAALSNCQPFVPQKWHLAPPTCNFNLHVFSPAPKTYLLIFTFAVRTLCMIDWNAWSPTFPFLHTSFVKVQKTFPLYFTYFVSASYIYLPYNLTYNPSCHQVHTATYSILLHLQ